MMRDSVIGHSPACIVAALVVTIGAASSFSPVRADDLAGDVPDLVWIDLGAAADDITTEVAVSTPNGVGTTLNLERSFCGNIGRFGYNVSGFSLFFNLAF
jgi:hypothetical protein